MSKYFRVRTNKSPIEYKCAEEIVFYIDACDNGKPFRLDFVRWECRTDDGKFESGVARCPFEVKTSCDRPGFARLTCKAFYENNELRSDIDVLEASAGAEIEKISLADDIPEDFDEFWGEIEKSVENHNPVFLKKELFEVQPPSGMEDYLCYDISISTPLKTPATGYITYPKVAGKLPIRLEFDGYSILTPEPGFTKNCITIVIGAHGLENGKTGFEQMNLPRVSTSYGFDKAENSDPKTAYWYGMMVRDLCAAKFAKSLPEWNGKTLISSGESQGALQATTVAAHEKAITLLDIGVPWFCNLNSANCGYMNGWFPEYANGLRYYDTAFQGTRVKCPVRIVACLGDYVCPPQTVTALYNGIKSEKELIFIQAGTHNYRPPEKNCYVINNDTSIRGKYYDYKGNKYEVLCIAVNPVTFEENIIYRDTDNNIFSISKWQWNEYVLHNGEYKKRFIAIGI